MEFIKIQRKGKKRIIIKGEIVHIHLDEHTVTIGTILNINGFNFEVISASIRFSEENYIYKMKCLFNRAFYSTFVIPITPVVLQDNSNKAHRVTDK
jgi:hypothetical protein